MTQYEWGRLTPREREAQRDFGGLSPQLTRWSGWRVEATTHDGQVRRFIVGQSNGWRPCSLELKRRDSVGGDPADRTYVRVLPLYRVFPVKSERPSQRRTHD